MKHAKKFAVSPSWAIFLQQINVDPEVALLHAQLPLDLFHRDNASLSPQEYFQLWHGIEKSVGDNDLPLMIADHLSLECFDVPLFACICSPNLNIAAQRLSQYKPLIGPMVLDVNITDTTTQITMSCYGYDRPIPKTVGLTELVFFTQLTRLATREQINPIALYLPHLPANQATYEDYFGCDLQQNNEVKISFSAQDAMRPFITSNSTMWEFFEEDLKKRLSALDSQASTAQRLKALLLEALPSGDYSTDTMSQKLAMSKRTLQRKLSEENESFKNILQIVREELAEYYLEKSNISLSEISFLLGYREPNSFIRAYSTWKGVSPGQRRDMLQ
ncbi:MAG: AraC family transcriptional regulator ligand-binding domain-containing protein [Alphaproteobacteria bacterium]